VGSEGESILELDFFWLALGIAVAGYFIGDGLKNFKKPYARGSIDFFDEEELINEHEVHYFIGISKEDTMALLDDYPDIPHLKINGKVYYPKAKLRQWLLSVGDDKEQEM
jgi:hypothetical protein